MGSHCLLPCCFHFRDCAMNSTTSIASNRVDDVCPALCATRLATRRHERGDVRCFDRATVGETVVLGKLIFRGLDLTEVVVTPRLRIRAGMNSSNQQQWSQRKNRKARRDPAFACTYATKKG